jgi:hypothetical protein
MAVVQPIPIYDRAGVDLQTRFTAFAFDFMQAYGRSDVPPWAEDPKLCVMTVGPQLQTDLPLPVSAAEFKKLLGEVEYRRLAAKMLKVKTDQWQDGVAEEARLLELPSFVGWGEEPMNMGIEARALGNRIVAGLLEDGNNIVSWENPEGVTTLKFFATGHPNNPFDTGAGTFDNYHTSKPLDTDGVDFAFEAFRAMKAPNGKTPRGLRLTHLLVHPTDERLAGRLVKQPRILVKSLDAGGSQVALVERINDIADLNLGLIVSDELTSKDYWYALAIMPGRGKPWVISKRVPGVQIPGMPDVPLPGSLAGQGVPWEWIINDKSSAYYKDLRPGYVSISARLDEGAALACPWTIIKFKKTA